MYYVYALRSLESGKLYIGFTRDLKKRYAQHRAKLSFATKSWGELKLVFYEAFLSRNDATRREKYLKTTKGKRTLRLMLKYSLS